MPPTAPPLDDGKTTDELIQRLGKQLREQTTATQEPVPTPSAPTPVPSTSSQPDQRQKHTERPTAQAPGASSSSHRSEDKPVADPTEPTVKDSVPPPKGLESPRDSISGGGDTPPKLVPTSDVVSSISAGGSSGSGRWLGGLAAILLLGGGAYAWTRSRRSHAAHGPLHKYARDGKDEKKPVPVNQGKGEQPNKPVTPKKEEPKKVSRRFALLVGVGFRRANEPKESADPDDPSRDDSRVKQFQLMIASLGAILGGLKVWGFDEKDVDKHTLVNAVGTKQNILNELQLLVDRVNGMPEGCVSCFVKIHLMGHTGISVPPANPKQKNAPKRPDAEPHHGLVTWDGRFEKTDCINPTQESLLYDYEIAHYVKQISDLMTKRLVENGGKLVKKDSGILVQSDQCYGEEVLSGVVKIPLVYAGWSAGKNSQVSTPDVVEKGVQVTPYAIGFSGPFDTSGEKTTIDEAHKAAADNAKDRSPNPERQGAGYTPTPEPTKPAESVVK